MATAKNFFEENIARINPHADPLAWNLNHGLLAIAQGQDRLKRELEELQRELRQLRQDVRQVQSRLP